MPLTITDENQIKGLLKAREIVAARIRYNLELFNYLRAAPEEEILTYHNQTHRCDSLIAPIVQQLGITPPEEFYTSLTEIRAKSIQYVKNDLKMLYELNFLLRKCMENDDQVFSLAEFLQKNIREDQQNIDKTMKFFDGAKQAIRRHFGDLPDVESKVGLVHQAKKTYLLQAKQKFEIYALKEIRDILHTYEVTGSFEIEFFAKYLRINYLDGQAIINMDIRALITLIKENLAKYNSAREECLSKTKKGAGVKLASEFVQQTIEAEFRDLKAGLAQHSAIPLEAKSTDVGAVLNTPSTSDDMYGLFVTNCRYNYKFSEWVDQARAKVLAAFSAEIKWQKEQDRIADAEKAVAEARLRESTKNSQQEQAWYAEEQQKINAQNRQERELRYQRHVEAEAARQKQKTLEQEQEEMQKHQHRQEMIANAAVKFDANCKIVGSQFMLSPAIIGANYDNLVHLYDPNTKKYRYRDVDSLIRSLGGRLETATGSSHQRVIFNATIYQEVDFDDEDPGSVVAGIARPHNGETVLRNHNLTLLRNAISSVLLADWKLICKPTKIGLSKLKV